MTFQLAKESATGKNINYETVDQLIYKGMDESTNCSNDNSTFYSHISSTESTPSHESNSEFEFSMSSAPGDQYESADQLFFKGQLLPLLLPSRIQMVQTLWSSGQFNESHELSHSEEDKTFGVSCSSSVVSEFRQNRSNCSLYGPMQPELLYCNSGRESQSGSKFWDSYDKLESADSSCRDSNGSSSQDSCFSSKDMETRERCEKGSEEVLTSTNGKTEKTRSSWLKLAFQWKLPFGSRKASKVKAEGKRKLKTISETHDARPNINVQNTLCDFLSTSPLCGDRSSRSSDMGRPNHGIRQHTIPVSSFSGRIYKALSSEKGAKEEIQRPGDSWQRYLKPLKHLREKASEKNNNRTTGDLNEQAWIEEYSTTVQPLSSFFERDSPYAKQSSCTSFLAASLRVPSFTRRSSAPTSRISSSRSSPNHSGVLSQPLDYATMADIHNAIQGAIAHCKQSQASKKESI